MLVMHNSWTRLSHSNMPDTYCILCLRHEISPEGSLLRHRGLDTETGCVWVCQDSDAEASMQEEEQQPLFCPKLKPFIPLGSWPEKC